MENLTETEGFGLLEAQWEDISGGNLFGVNLERANLERANLPGANLSGANLSGANLLAANLSGANLSGASVDGADLYWAHLSGADLRESDLTGTDLTEARANQDTIWPKGFDPFAAGVTFKSVVVVDEERRSLERDIDFAIQTYLRRAYGLSIGERTAEEINRHIGSAASPPYEGRVEVKGREVMSGLPKTVVLTSVEIRRAIEEP
jgi:hypothetical protein